MKPILYFLSAILLIASHKAVSQNRYCTISVNINKRCFKEKELRIKLYKEIGSRWDTTITLTDSLSVIKIPVKEPFYANIRLLNEQDKMLSETGSILCTADPVSVSFLLRGEPGKVTGGENDFMNKTRYILFDMPLSLYRAFDGNVRLIRQDTTLNTTNGEVYIRYEEYKNLIIDII